MRESPHRFRALLGAGEWFGHLDPPLQDALLDAAQTRTLVAGERLFTRGDPPCGLYAVVAGAMRITAQSAAGREVILGLAMPPTWFGEIAVFDERPRTHDAIADVESQVICIDQAAMIALTDAHPTLWRALGVLLGAKLRLTFALLEQSATASTSARLAHRLVLMAASYGQWRDRSARSVEVSQEQLASMLAVSRQTVNQILRAFEAKSWVRLAYGEVEITDLEALRCFVDEDTNSH